MDKLEPILKNRFWILLVPLFSMNLWGYFSANSALKADTAKRESELKSAISGIPAGTNDANETYSAELKKRNEILKTYVDEELLGLWKRQQKRMIWPLRVAARIPKTYRDPNLHETIRFDYMKNYPLVIQELHESVEPFVPKKGKETLPWTPKVDFPLHLIPQMKIGKLTTTSEEMWDAQEDIWMTQFILEAIRQMNKDVDSPNSASVRRVIAFRLLGGDGVAAGGEGAAPAGEGEGSAAYMNASMMGGGGAGGASKVTSSVKFSPTEEFGAGGEPVSAAGGYGGQSSMMMSTPPSSEGDAAADPSAAPTGPLRYVGESEKTPYHERGFYLSVIIDQKNLVDFLVALSNSEWPVRVVRFHFGKNPYGSDPYARGGAAGGGYGGMGMSSAGGFPSGSNYPGGGGGQSSSPFQSGAGGEGASSADFPSSSPGMQSGVMGAMGGGALANTGYPASALENADLVQLDLAGLITMYKQPASEIAPPAETPAATEGETPAEKSAETTDAATTTTEPAPAATEGDPKPDAPATEAGTPAPETTPEAAAATPEAPVTEAAPAAPEPAATEPATPATPATEPATNAPTTPPAAPAAENPAPAAAEAPAKPE